MGDWNFLGGILEEVHIHSTMVGKIWLTILFIFRMLVLGVAAEDVWNDEQNAFVCNTEQPGCRNVCYDRAFPISLIRFWVLQVIFVSSPSLVYMGHALYRLRALEKTRQRKKALLRRELELLDAVEMAVARRTLEREVRQVEQGRLNKAPLRGSLLRTYVAHIVTRSAVEVAFMAGQYLLYGVRLQPLFLCERAPCPNAVDCYVSRPTEKSVFMAFMQCIAGVSLFLNLLEITHLGYKKVRKGVFSYCPHLRGDGDKLPEDFYPNHQQHRCRASSAGQPRSPTAASAPSDSSLLLGGIRRPTTYPPLPRPSLSLPLPHWGMEQALLCVLDEPEGSVCSPTKTHLHPAQTTSPGPGSGGDPPSPERIRHHRGEAGGAVEDQDLLHGGGSSQPACPTLPVSASRRPWTRCSTVMESRSSDTDSYGEAVTTSGGSAGHPAARIRPNYDAKRPGPRPSTPESQKDSSSGSMDSPRAPSSHCRTSVGSGSSSKRIPDLRI